MKKLYPLLLLFFFSSVLKAEIAICKKNTLVKSYDVTSEQDRKFELVLNVPSSSWKSFRIKKNKEVYVELLNDNADLDVSALLRLKKRKLLKSVVPKRSSSTEELFLLDYSNLSFIRLFGMIPSALCELIIVKPNESFRNNFAVDAHCKSDALSTLGVFVMA